MKKNCNTEIKIPNYNYHSHTKRCGHAIGEDEEYVIEAIKNGYKYMGFSDHAPYANDNSPKERMKKEELKSYIQSVKELQKKYKNEIEIRIGLECEYYEKQLDEILEYREMFDYIILGQHEPGLYEVGFYDANTDEDVIKYGNLIRKACEKGIPDIIAHPDLFMFSKPVWTKACEDATHMICQSASKYHIPLEVNLNGIRYGKRQIGNEYRYTYPYRKFWEIAQTYPIDVVYGLDAHDPKKYEDKKCYEIIHDEVIHDLDLHFLNSLKFEKKIK